MIDRTELPVTKLTNAELYLIASSGRTENEPEMKVLPPMPFGERAATAAFDPSPTSPLRHPGQAQTLIDALASGEEDWIIACCMIAVAADGKA